MSLTDTHCHLDDAKFEEDLNLVIQRALDAGVVRMLCPGTDLESSRAAVAIAENYEEVYAAVGIHPNSGLSWNGETLDELRDLSEHPKVMAIGEIGLDYYRDGAPRYVQEQILQYQLELASERELPVVIHNRESTKDLLRMLSSWYNDLVERDSELVNRSGVLHSYSGNIEDAEQATTNGFYIGFTGPVTFKNAEGLREVAAIVDVERLLIETDAPYLSPHPNRGKRNEPMQVKLISDKLAEIREMPREALIQKTYENAERLFLW